MINESYLCQVLQAAEIDTSFIDHSLSYRENKDNLYKQFGIRFSQENYSKKYRRADELIRSKDTTIANMRTPAEPPQVESQPAPLFPFDPVKRAKDMESLVIRGTMRAYYRVRFAARFDCPVTIDSEKCCLDCAFCWNAMRNHDPVVRGKFYEPHEIAEKAMEVAIENKQWRFRMSGCEAILGKASTDHFCAVMDEILKRPKGKKAIFLLETNGIMLGRDKSLVQQLSKYKDHLAVRVSIKGDSPEQYEKLSGAVASSYKYQKLALDYCYQADIPSLPAIMSTFMDLKKVSAWLKIHPDDIDQEALKYYPLTKKSLIERGCWDMRIIKEKAVKKAKTGC